MIPADELLFQRIVLTWIAPAATEYLRARDPGGTLPINMAFVVWENPGQPATTYLNEQVGPHVQTVRVRLGRRVSEHPIRTAGELFGSVTAIEGVHVAEQHYPHPWIFVTQGSQGYYTQFRRLRHLRDHRHFALLGDRLARHPQPLFLEYEDVLTYQAGTPGLADLPPHEKRAITIDQRRQMEEWARQNSLASVRRSHRLPPVVATAAPGVYQLVEEARRAYVIGLYFAAIAAAVTTADRVLNYLVRWYHLPQAERTWFDDETLGNKINRARAIGLLTDTEADYVAELNAIRNRYLHVRSPISELTEKRDARRALERLHALLGTTVGVDEHFEVREEPYSCKPRLLE